jgi:hypothetical protein
MRKTLPFLVIALTLACRHGMQYNATHLSNLCPGAGHSMDPPIVCLDPGSPNTVSQNPMVLSYEQKPGRRFGHFFVNGDRDTVTISCDDPDAVVYFNNGTSHVTVRGKKIGSFKYHFKFGSGGQSDPDMQIDP